ncbi:tripartite tricarboxylate transporter substrate binding protein [Ottowia thiooxydans]|uniref:tripartite tricarboxylate transporter substrate binding protein n=1 Tax=Ottowia thiooxydans TaxID=219182 RepID=UPI00041EDDDD|nr:tripartite tricarboxylate transporter substrate binding protein [Ottowia thiooxydans]
MHSLSRRQFATSLLALTAGSASQVAWANDFPNRPIRLVVPYGAGGGSDFVGRLIAQKLTETAKWNVVVDNKAGASSMIGTDAVAKSVADGYTLLLADTAHATNAAVVAKLSFDPVKDFAPVTLVGSSPQLLVAHPSLPANNLKELLALPRSQSRQFGVGTPGQGSAPHLLYEMLKLQSGMELVNVPYKGGALALNDAVGGQIPMVINSMPACMPHIEAKRLKVLAIASPARNPKLPNVQTFAESVPGILGSAWYGFMAPANTPADILQELDSTIQGVLKLPEVQARLASAFIDPLPPGPQAFAKLLKDEIARFQDVVKRTGFTQNS